MHRHDRARAVGDLRRDVLRIEIQCYRIDVREDRRRAPPRNRLGGRIEGEGRADDLVAGTDLHRVECDDDRIGAVADPDRLRDAEKRRRFLLEGVVVRSTNELAAAEDLAEASFELGLERCVLRFDVNQRDLHGVSS